jgi:uncharacterized protein YdbL (DUF1318 family)
MKRYLYTAILLTLIVYALTGCKSTPSCLTVVPPEINLTGEKTVIERQIVGDYMELEKDAWTVSSIRTTVGKTEGSSQGSGDPEIIKAIKVREFHAGKIRDYKTEGAIGETSSGYVSYIDTAQYESSPELQKVLLSVIEEENRARRDIFIKTLTKSGGKEPSKNEIDSFGKIFSEEQRALAQKGDWIQENSGKWTRKK